MRGFDRAADIYDQTRGFPPGVGQRVAESLVNFVGLTPDDRALEIGIGTGRIGKPLAAILGSNHHLVGIDLSRRMMDQLGATAPPGVRPPALVEADALSIPFPARTFRAIVVVHVLHLIREWETLLAEVSRVRALGGMFVGGWNDHPPESSAERIGQKSREIAAARGVPIKRQGLAGFAELAPHIPGARAQTVVAAEWTVERAPSLALQSIAERHFSSSWMIPDDIFPAVLADVQAWAQSEWRDLDCAIAESRQFKWMKIEW